MADFFSTVDSMDLLEKQTQEVLALEEAQAKKLLAVYNRVASKLRYRLARLPEDRYSAQQVRVVLVQVEIAIRALESELQEANREAIVKIGGRGVEHLVKEINAFSDMFRGSVRPVPLDPLLASLETDNLLFNQYDASLATYSQDLRTRFATALQNSFAMGHTQEQAISAADRDTAIGQFFDGEEWRLRRIVRTEMHNIYSVAKLQGMQNVEKEFVPGMMKTLYHPLDSRTADDSLYAMKLNLVVPLDQPFEYTYRPKKGKPIHRIFMQPPDRPNDRSIMIPYHPNWD